MITGSAGGLFLTNSKEDADKVRKWSTQSREAAPWYQHEEIGYNYRMSNIIAGSKIGDNFQTGHQVTIREKAEIGNNVSIGTLSDIQGNCKIGNYVRLHSNVHIGQLSVIDGFVWIFPYGKT